MIEVSAMVAIAMGLSEMLKKAELIPAKFIPLVNLGLGIGASFVWNQTDWRTALLQGVIVGLTASGLFSGVKNVMEGVKSK